MLFRSVFFFILCVIFISCNTEDLKVDGNTTSSEYEVSLVNPNYVPIDWGETQLLDYRPEKGVFSFQATPSTRNLHVGSVVTIDTDTAGYIAVVKNVLSDNGIVTIETIPGSLCDIFANTKFTLSTSGNSVRSKNVYSPVSVIFRDDDGFLREVDFTRAKSGLTDNIWNWGKDFSGEVLFQGDNYKVYLEKAFYNASIDFELTLNFSERTVFESVIEAYKLYRSNALEIEASIVGNVFAEQILRFDISGSSSYYIDELWKRNFYKPVTVKFLVGNVPVYVNLKADLYRGVSLEAEGEISAYGGFSDSATGSLGFYWKQGEGISPKKSLKNEYKLTYPTIEGDGKVKAKAWFYPRIQMYIYGLLGPYFDLKPYLRNDLSGGFKEELLNSSNDFCAWSLRNYVGLDAEVGFDLIFFNGESKVVSSPSFNIIDKLIYKSPHDIKFGGSSSEKVLANEPNNVSFEVYDADSIYKKEVLTPLAQFVKFEGNGILSSKYGIASKGKVSVTWTPNSSSDTLYAVLYGTDGEKLKQARFYGMEPTAITGDYSDITYNSVKINCQYENVPSGSEYGLKVYSDNNFYTIPANITGSSGEYVFEVVDLKPENEYSYYAYISFMGREYKGEIKTFTTDWDNTPTSGSVIDLGLNVKWASCNVGAQSPEKYGNYYSWGSALGIVFSDNMRLPNKDDIVEIISKCRWKRTIYNGVRGMTATGPNGNTIFFPYTMEGGCSGTPERYEGGYYWSSTRGGSSEFAHGLYLPINSDAPKLGSFAHVTFGQYNMLYNCFTVRAVKY